MILALYTVSTIITFIIISICIIKELFIFGDNSEVSMWILTVIISLIPIVNILMSGMFTIVLIFDFISKYKKKRKEKLEAEKEKYKNSLSRVKNKTGGFKHYKISEILYSIIDNYSIIIKYDSHKDMAFNRVEYFMTFLNECIHNDMLDDQDIMNEVISMAQSVDKLLLEIVKDITDTKNKVNKQVKEYLLSKTNEFKNITNSMTNDFKSTK